MASTYIICTGRIVGGEIEMDIAMPTLVEPQDVELQRMIDEAEMSADYEDYLLDIDWLRGGCR